MGKTKSVIKGCIWLFVIICILGACFGVDDTQEATETTEIVQTEISASELTSAPAVSSTVTTTISTTTANTTTHKTTAAKTAKTTAKTTTKTTAKTTSKAATKAAQSQSMVWIPNTGSKYHKNSGCSKMKNPSKVSLSKAQSLGYTPCKKCY